MIYAANIAVVENYQRRDSSAIYWASKDRFYVKKEMCDNYDFSAQVLCKLEIYEKGIT